MIYRSNSFTVLILLIALFAGIIFPASAAVPEPCEFFGKLTIYGSPAPTGSVVVARIGGQDRGSITTTIAGQYGTSCPLGKRLNVQPAEGEYTGKGVLKVDFFVNGERADQTGIFSPGAMKWQDLTVRFRPTPSPTPTEVPLIADFDASPTEGCAPLRVEFSDHTTPVPDGWSWEFGDGGLSTVKDPVHTYAGAGNYTVILTITGDAGTSVSTRNEYIRVEAPVFLTLPDQLAPPTDPDHDGFYEDLNGNGFTDFDDLAVYFHFLEWIPENEPINPFDYNQNGLIDFDDLVVLFSEL
ncbi:MAG: PKD domain-containing protein [Methanolinea sp.]|nr:PKD domain-containing protein [Methanolinea sp.]